MTSPLQIYLDFCQTLSSSSSKRVSQQSDIVKLLSQHESFATITDLDFSRTIVSHYSLPPLLEIVKRCFNLESLLLPSNSIDNERAIKIIEALEGGGGGSHNNNNNNNNCSKLTKLVLSGNPISDQGGKRIAKFAMNQNFPLMADYNNNNNNNNNRREDEEAKARSSNKRTEFLHIDVSSTQMNYGLMRKIASFCPSRSSSKETTPVKQINVGDHQKQGVDDLKIPSCVPPLPSFGNNDDDNADQLNQQQPSLLLLLNRQHNHQNSSENNNNNNATPFYALEALWKVAEQEVKTNETSNPEEKRRQEIVDNDDEMIMVNANHHTGGTDAERVSNSFRGESFERPIDREQIGGVNPCQKESLLHPTNDASISRGTPLNASTTNNNTTTPCPLENTLPAADQLLTQHSNVSSSQQQLQPSSSSSSASAVSPLPSTAAAFPQLGKMDKEEREKYFASGLPCVVHCIRSSPNVSSSASASATWLQESIIRISSSNLMSNATVLATN